MPRTKRPTTYADPTKEFLFRRVLQYPRSRESKLVLADRCEELGEALEAEFWRLLWDKSPRAQKGTKAWDSPNGKVWKWYEGSQHRKDSLSICLHPLLKVVDDFNPEDVSYPLIFYTPERAWTALVVRWCEMTEAEREEVRRDLRRG